MGIVVTIFMALGLLLLAPFSTIKFNTFGRNHKQINWVGIGLLLAGVWNAFWHGLRFLDSFWGITALVSGSIMIMAAVIILSKSQNSIIVRNNFFHVIAGVLVPYSLIASLLLFVCFLLYAVTLIQLNLGLPIIQ